MILEVDGLKIHYKLTGKGKDVVILHGWGCDIKSVEPVQNELDNYFRTISIDLPGFGQSDPPPVPWGVDEYTKQIEGVLSELNVINPIMIGHSFGGKIVICFAAENKVHKLILVDSAGIKPKRKLTYYGKVYLYKTMKQIIKLPIFAARSEGILEAYKKKIGSADYRNSSGVMQKTLVRVVNEDIRNRLYLIKAPTLLIWGENDSATPVSDGKLMEKIIPDAGLVILKGVGHFSYLDKLCDFIIIVKQFLKDDMEAFGV